MNILDRRSISEFRLGLLITGKENFILAMARKLREKSHLEAEGWSEWMFSMAPEETTRQGTNLTERGNGQVGLKNVKLRDKLKEQNENVENLCGIYEWRATRHGGREPTVVYVGSTCPRPSGRWQRMANRILKYTKDGDHKEELINDALRNGYELWVRFKPANGNVTEARRMENDLLDKYDYACNIRRNVQERNIL